MRTARLLTVLGGSAFLGVCLPGGVCLLGRVCLPGGSAFLRGICLPGGVCLPGEGLLSWGGLPSWGGCLPGGSAFLGGLPSCGGGLPSCVIHPCVTPLCDHVTYPMMHLMSHTPQVDRMTDTCKNITFTRFATWTVTRLVVS